MKTRVLLLALIAGLASVSAGAADQILTFTNLGPVRIGMTQPEAEAALHAKLRPFNSGAAKECWFGVRADGLYETVSYLFRDGKVTAINVSDNRSPTPGTSALPVATERGIHIGAPAADVRKAYASSPIIDERHTDYDFIRLFSPDRQYGISFDVATGKVSNITAGAAEDSIIVEPCL